MLAPGPGGHAVAGIGRLEHRIDQLQDRRRRAEREVQRLLAPRLPAGLGAGAKALPQALVGRDVRPLHAHDRLLLVADHEQRAARRARAAADEELGRERLDDRPLRRARVLALVDQQMIDLLVELVLHPGHRIRRLEEVAGALDQIVVVQRCKPRLALRIALEHGRPDPQQGCRALRHARRLGLLRPRREALLLGHQRVDRRGRRRLPGDDVALRLRRPVAGAQEHGLVVPKALDATALVCRQPGRDQGAALAIPVAAALQRAAGGEQGAPVDRGVGAGRRANRLRRGARRQVERPVERCDHGLRIAEVGAGAQALLAQLGEPACQRALAQQHGERREVRLDLCLPARQDLLLRLAHQVGRGARLDHVEMRRHARFQRKAPQQRLAKAVDRHDRQAGRQVEHARQQDSRVGELAGRRRASQEMAQVVGKRRIRQGRETAEIGLHARHHLGGRGLGEGEAEDLLRLAAGQQQAQHPIGEHAGLAGAGRSGDPDRACRVGRAALLVRRGVAAGLRRGHQLDHSPRRER